MILVIPALGAFFSISSLSLVSIPSEGGTTREDNVGIEVGSNINIAIIDRLDAELSKTKSLITLLGKSRLEDELGGLESGSVDLNDLSIGELEVLVVLVG